MSRSLHTTPLAIRAPRRVREPWARRGTGAPRLAFAQIRAAKYRGQVLLADAARSAASTEAPLPRIGVTAPRPGCCHPIGQTEIVELLRFFGEVGTYGLREIILARQPVQPRPGLLFGTLIVPGRIVLYEQPCPPWSLPGVINHQAAERLRQAGATVEASLGGLRTTVDWPGETLRDFFRFDVLMHEIGHHLVQHNRAKRTIRVMRTRDHEAFADRLARRCRACWLARGAESAGGGLPAASPPTHFG